MTDEPTDEELPRRLVEEQKRLASGPVWVLRDGRWALEDVRLEAK